MDRDVSHDQDVVYFGASKVMVARVEAGAIREASLFDLNPESHYNQVCMNFLLVYYCQSSQRATKGKELIVNHLDDPKAAAEALKESCGQRIRITVPKRGMKLDLLKLCEQNLAINNTLPVRKLG